MYKGMNRRDFLKVIGSGTAVISMPGALSGCMSRRTVLAGGPTGNGGYFDQFGLSPELIRKILSKGLSRGGDFSEVFAQNWVNHWVGMEDEQINRAYTNIDLGVGIRVLKGDATGYAYSEDLSEKALLAAADTAAAVADNPSDLQPKSFSPSTTPNRYHLEVPWLNVEIERKLPIIDRANQAVRARDASIIKVTVNLSDDTNRILVANSEGLWIEDDQPMGLLMVMCVASKNGKTEVGYQSRSSRDGIDFFTDEAIDEVACQAADYATMLFDAVEAPIGEMPVVLAPGVTGILLHEAMGHGFEADFNRKGTSIYADRIGERIAPEFVTVLDDGTNLRLRGSLNIDDEGTIAKRTVLVENGILRSYMHDRISARHYQTESTGSGRRQSFRFPPVPRMRNTYMLNGPHKPEEIIRSVKKGLYAEVFSNGQVDIGAGDFTFFLKHGRLIENGKLTAVVKDANLIGSGPKVLENIHMVADDMEMFSGGGMCGKDGQAVPVGFGLPTTKVGAISIGGRSS